MRPGASTRVAGVPGEGTITAMLSGVHVVATVLRDVHEAWAWFVIIGNAMAGTWSLVAHWVDAVRTRALWWFVGVVEVAIFVQVGLGVGLVAGQGFVAPQFHMFYGFVAIIAVGLLYSYRSQMWAWRYLLYGFGGLFLMGLGIRAMLITPLG